MRAAVVLALAGASTSALASAHAEQPHKTGAIAVAARHDNVGGIFFEMEATTDLEVEATSNPLVVSESTPEQEAPWTGVDTTVTVEAPVWKTNGTNTPATPLPTEEANPTDAEPTEVTGGALPQPMKASAAGLLGFFIMSLACSWRATIIVLAFWIYP
ncbi:hypothetical protein LIA77_03999 [Sarocladium implicatum]|nr:hypothetical protein LIA77_03999 [Sarocladium implicatum]